MFDPPHLHTERLTLRMARVDEASALLRYQIENRDHLQATRPDVPKEFYQREFWKDLIHLYEDQFFEGRSVRLFLFKNESPSVVVGTVGLSEIVRGPFQAAYLGYDIALQEQGKGLMREALTRVIDYAFSTLRLHRIMANHLPDNQRSSGLLRRLGFVEEGIAKQYLLIRGSWRDHVLTSLTNANWQPLES